MRTIFHEIVEGKLKADVVYNGVNVMAFKDIHPKSDVHLLIVPKKAYRNMQEIPQDEISIIAEIATVAQHLADEFELDSGYRFLTNVGPISGQEVEYLHFHLIGGKKRLGSIA